MSLDPIFATFATDNVSAETAIVNIDLNSVPGAGTAGQTLTIAWGSNSLTFTMSASPGNDPLLLPIPAGGTSAAAYIETLAEAFRQNEVLYSELNVTTGLSGSTNFIRISTRTSEATTFTVTDGLSFATATAIAASSPPELEENIRLLVEVFTDTGDDDTAASLGQQHSPYRTADSLTDIDFSHHFAHLRPHPPSTASIAAFASGHASNAYQRWYYRYADQYGTPPVAEKMVKNGSTLTTFYGSASPQAGRVWADENIRHNYQRRDGLTFWKPIGQDQPDWLYYWNNASGSNFGYEIFAYYEDGTSGSLFTSAPFSMTANQLLWFACGPLQLQDDGIDFSPSGSSNVYRYEWRLKNYTTSATLATAYFELSTECAPWGKYLLFDNGLGGCETVWLRGIHQEGYDVGGELFRTIRTNAFAVADGELGKTNFQAQATFTASTGYHHDDYYLDHLRQLPLSSTAWLVDVENERFLRVIVEADRIDQVRRDDEDLFSLTFELRAAWFDQAANV